MTDILEYLVRHCSFLWIAHRYRIIDSGYGRGFGDAFLVVASDIVQLTFIKERGKLFLDVQGVVKGADQRSYSIDLFWHLIRGEPRTSAALDEEYALFLKEHLGEMESLFTNESRLADLSRRLHELMVARSKRMFG